ncbi:MAG: glycosyltransferase family 39 protein [Bacteroidota bacterium]|nr:glycosyltransferase family 39 protein [Bacteroidota bacterium]
MLDKLKWSNLLLLIIILIITGVLSYLTLNAGHDWGDDFALYIRQAQSIINGTQQQCLEDNTFAMDRSSGPTGPYLYPWGFPLILATTYTLSGFNLLAFKFTGIVFFLLSLLLTYFIFKKRSTSNALIIVALIGFNPYFISFTDNVLSDFPFLFFSLLSLFLIYKIVLASNEEYKHFLWYLFLGFVLFYSFYIRPNGIVILLVLMLTQLIAYSIKINTPKKPFSLKPFLPYAGFLLFFITSKVYFPQVKESHLDFLGRIHLQQITNNIEYYFIELPKVFFGHYQSFNLAFILFPFAIIGSLISIKKEYHLHLFFFGTLTLFIIWPDDSQGLRFIFPLLPIFLYFSFSGISFVNQKINFYSRYNGLSIIAGLILIFLFLKQSYTQAFENVNSLNKVVEGPFEAESTEAFNYLQRNSSNEDVIVFFKPRTLNLLISRRSVLIYDFEKIKSVNGSHLVLHKHMSDFNQVKPDDTRLNTTSWLKLVFENKYYLIYKIN